MNKHVILSFRVRVSVCLFYFTHHQFVQGVPGFSTWCLVQVRLKHRKRINLIEQTRCFSSLLEFNLFYT